MGRWESERLPGHNPCVSERWPEPPLGLWEVSPRRNRGAPGSAQQERRTAWAPRPDSLMLADGERGEARVSLTKLHSRTDVLIVLVPPLALFRVGCQVRVHDTDAGVVELEPDGHPSFVTLRKRAQKNRIRSLIVSATPTCTLSRWVLSKIILTGK